MPGTNTNQTFCLHWKFTARPCQTMSVVLAYRVRRVIDSEFSKFPRMPGRFGPGPTSTINRIDKPWHGRAIVHVHTARFYLWTMLRCNRLEDIVVDKLTVTNFQVDRTDWKNEFDWIRTKPVNLFEQLESWIKGMESVALFLTSFQKFCSTFITIDKLRFRYRIRSRSVKRISDEMEFRTRLNIKIAKKIGENNTFF